MSLNKVTIEIEPIEDKRFELKIVVVGANRGQQTYMATVPTVDGGVFGYEMRGAIEKGLDDLMKWEGEKRG